MITKVLIPSHSAPRSWDYPIIFQLQQSWGIVRPVFDAFSRHFRIPISDAIPRVLGVRILVDDANSTTFSYDNDNIDWTATSPSSPCSNCPLQPDPARVIGGTWHYTTSNTTASISFVGVAIEIYTIIPPDFNTTAPNIWYFVLDNEDDGYFQAPGRPNVGSYVYNFLAYARSDLTYGLHAVRISNLSPSLILLDYAIYDDGVSAPPAASRSTTARTSATSAASATPSRSASAPTPPQMQPFQLELSLEYRSLRMFCSFGTGDRG